MESIQILETESFNETTTPELPVARVRELLSDEARGIIDPILWFAMLPLNVMGVVTNSINIRVFVQQGVRNDSTNIGFVFLSACDLLSCLTLIPYSSCFFVTYTHGLADHMTCTAFGLQFVYAHISFQHVGAWTTVYLSLIRCFCVIFPLKVKFMFSPRTTVIYLIIVFVFFSATQITYGSFTNLEWEFVPDLNATVAIVKDTPSARIYIYYKLLVINQIMPALAAIIVSINTVLLGRKLLQVKKWRQKNSNSNSNSNPSGAETTTKPDSQTENGMGAAVTGEHPPNTNTSISNSKKSATKPLASKEIELIKFINTVTSIFLVCVLMAFVPSVAVMVLPEVNMTGVNHNLFYVVFWIRFLFDAVNSSVNFFFYLRVSSRYKEAFDTAFKTCSSRLVG